MLSKPNQSPTCKRSGSTVFGDTQSIESHVGPQTLATPFGSDAEIWKELFIDNTYGWMTWWSNRMQLKAPYTPSLI